jgi:hypothetical protein
MVSTTMKLEATTVNFNKVTSASAAPVKGENPWNFQEFPQVIEYVERGS